MSLSTNHQKPLHRPLGLDNVNTTTANVTGHLSGDNRSSDNVPFFDNYYARERIIAESILAAIAFGLNAVAFISSRLGQHQHYAYYALFKNLTFANALFCLSLWLSNNILVLFGSQLSTQSICTLMSMMVIALIANSVFGLVSTTTLMGFSIVHYMAVCHPQIYPDRVNKLTVKTCIAAIWGIYCTLAIVPIIVLMIKTAANCGPEKVAFIELLSKAFVNITLALLQSVVIIIFGFCVRIHKEIRTLQSRLSNFCWMDEMELEKRTFRSIILLVCTLVLFVLPFNIVFVISYNADTTEMINSRATLFYMTLLPYFKFITDPILYRKTVDGLHSRVKSLFDTCMCNKCHRKEAKPQRGSLTTRFTTYRLSSRREAKMRTVTVL